MKKAAALAAVLLVLGLFAPLAGYYLALCAAGDTAPGGTQDVFASASGQAVRTDTAQTDAFAADADGPSAQSTPKAAGTADSSFAADTATAEEPPFLVYDEGSGQVLTVPVRDYLIGAVASEMPYTWPDEALKAQAVAAHSYVLYCKASASAAALSGAYVSADPARRQGFMTLPVLKAYWGTRFEANYARFSALVDEVLDTVLLYDGAPAAASYYAISNGSTEASENVWGTPLPYLTRVDSPADCEADGYETAVTFREAQLYDILVQKLGIKADGWTPDTYFANPSYTDAGYVSALDVCGVPVRGTALRKAFGLRSTCFTVVYADGVFTFTTRGYGHGVGLSQWGAKTMAEQDSTWQDILAYYFPGTAPGSAAALCR